MVSTKRIVVGVIVALLAVSYEIWRRFALYPLESLPVPLHGKTCVVTGATEGIGKESAIAFATWGCNLILPVRSEKKGHAVKKEILDLLSVTKDPKQTIDVYGNVDFADFSTVRQFVKVLQDDGKVSIDILMNNAGYVQFSPEKTVDGNDVMFQVNHLSPFLLTYLLLPMLEKSQSPQARVVFVGSLAHYNGVLDRYTYGVNSPRGMNISIALARYDNSKLMNTMTAMSLAERYKSKKVTFNSVHPGFVVSALDSNLPFPIRQFMVTARNLLARSTKQGAISQIAVATHPKLVDVSGKYFSDHCIDNLCNSSCIYCDRQNPPGVIPNRLALDKSLRDWLWETSCELTGVKTF
jgi:retinol dehydrogenase-12